MALQDKLAHMFGPLSFPEITNCKSQFTDLDDEPRATKCLLCDITYTLPTQEKEFLSHLFQQHRLVIGDVEKIASLKSYLRYWTVKFKDEPLITFCTTLLMDCTPDGKPSKNEVYFLLSDCIAEDKTLRDELKRAKLEWILAQQAKERADTTFKRGCIFCRMEFSGSRSIYLHHLSQRHNVQLGRPENLVFIDQLLDNVQSKIENLTCIYCEKLFKDRTVLKEHMRKKLHKRVNPNNKTYDKFYVINYLEPGKSWQQLQGNADDTEDPWCSSGSENEENAWADWNGESSSVRCLFCAHCDQEFATLLRHMKEEHKFDFESVTKNLTFYQKVKAVNYVRRQMHSKHCVFCDEMPQNLVEHMNYEEHYKLPTQRAWDQPEFYFPTYENDAFLCNLDTNDDDDEGSDVGILSRDMENL